MTSTFIHSTRFSHNDKSSFTICGWRLINSLFNLRAVAIDPNLYRALPNHCRTPICFDWEISRIPSSNCRDKRSPQWTRQVWAQRQGKIYHWAETDKTWTLCSNCSQIKPAYHIEQNSAVGAWTKACEHTDHHHNRSRYDQQCGQREAKVWRYLEHFRYGNTHPQAEYEE